MLPEMQQATNDRFTHILTLEPGWDGYDARRIDPDIVQDAITFIEALGVTADVFVAPLAYGGLQLEFSNGDIEIEVEFQAPGMAQVLVERIKSIRRAATR